MSHTLEHITASTVAELGELEQRMLQAHARLEQLVKLNMAACKAALGEFVGCAHALLAARDAGEILRLQTELTQALAVKSADHGKHLFGLTCRAGTDFAQRIEAELAEAKNVFADAMDKIIENAPLGTESTPGALKRDVQALRNMIE